MTQTFFWKEANHYYPQGCQCGNNGGGDCDWCRVYYGDDKPWIDEEGRYCPKPGLELTKIVPTASQDITESSGMDAANLLILGDGPIIASTHQLN